MVPAAAISAEVMASSMLELLDTAVLVLSPEGQVETLNDAAERALGFSRERAVGQRVDALAALPEALRDAVKRTRADQRRRHLGECTLAGGRYDCNIQALSSGEVLVELFDLQWEQQRQQLQQREVQTGLLDLLRRNLGHELRNPLGGIRGAAQMMAEELGDAELGTLARLIMREVDRIEELIRRFSQPRLNRRRVDIHRVLDEAIELMLADASGGPEVLRDFDPSIPGVPGDATALRQVLINLLLNAAQAGARTVRLCTRIEHGTALLQPGHATLVRIDVEDDGQGVPESLRAMLFLPLVSGRRGGTGLGLALAQQIAAAHGGLLAYEPLEQGSRFTLRLPVLDGTGAGHE